MEEKNCGIGIQWNVEVKMNKLNSCTNKDEIQKYS